MDINDKNMTIPLHPQGLVATCKCINFCRGILYPNLFEYPINLLRFLYSDLIRNGELHEQISRWQRQHAWWIYGRIVP